MSLSQTITARLQARDESFSSTLKKASSALSDFSNSGKQVAQAQSGINSTFKSIAGAIGLVKVASAGVTAIMDNIGGAIERFDILERFPKIMERMDVPIADSTKAINELSDGIDGLPTSLDSIVKTTQQLFPIMKNDINKATKSSLALNNAFLASGATSADASRGLIQYSQMLAIGKVDMQSWRTLQETMPYALSKTAKALGVTSGNTAELYQQLKGGSITLEQLNDKFIELNGGVNGFAEVAKTATGGIGTAITNFGIRVKKGLEKALGEFNNTSKQLTGLDIATIISNAGTKSSKAIEESAKKITGFINANKEDIKSFFNFIKTMFEQSKTLWTPYVEAFKTAFKEIAPSIKEAVSAVGTSLGLLTNQIDTAGNVDKFKSGITIATDAIKTFANFVRDNSDKVAYLIVQLPKLLAGYMAFKKVTEISKNIAGFSANILDTSSKINDFVKKANTFTTNNIKKGLDVISPKLSTVATGFEKLGGAIAHPMLSLSNFSAYLSNASLASGGAGTALNGLYSVLNGKLGGSLDKTKTALSLAKDGLVSFGSAVAHPKSTLIGFGETLAQFSLNGFSASGTVASLASVFKGGFVNAMSIAGGAVKGFTATLMANPIGLILAGITASVAVFALSWKGNFGNVQGVTKTVLSNLGNTFRSIGSELGKLSDSISPSIKKYLTMENVAKAFSATLLASLTPIGLVIDAFRLIIMTVTGVINAFKLAYLQVKRFFSVGSERKKLTSEIEAVEKQLKGTYDGLAKNSATGAIWSGFSEIGKKGVKTAEDYKNMADSIISSNQKMAESSQQTGQKISESGNKVSEAFNVDGASERIKAQSQAQLEIVKRFGEQRAELQSKQAELEAQLSQAKDGEKQGALIKYHQGMMSLYNTNNADVLALMQSNSAQLKSNKDIEGKELTESQRNAMIEQNNALREGLMEQQQIVVDSSLAKIASGQKLSQTEQAMVQSNLIALYANQKETISANEAEIVELRKVAGDKTNEIAAANAQAKLDQLLASNETERAKMAENQQAIFQILSESGQLNAQKVAETLQAMGVTTDEGLAQLYLKYQQNNANTSEQLTLLAGIMQSKGIEGSNALVQALSSGDYSGIGAQSAQAVLQGLSVLPASMFANGQAGKDQLMASLSSGTVDASTVASQITSALGTGLLQGGAGVSSAGQQVINDANEQTKTKAQDFLQSGGLITDYIGKGVANGKGSVKGSVQSTVAYGQTPDLSGFVPIGGHISSGIAKGIDENSFMVEDAVAKVVQNAKTRATKEGEIHSPSRLFKREVGQWIPAGVAKGIDENAYLVDRSVESMISDVNRDFDFGHDTNFGASVNSEISHTVKNPIFDKLSQAFEDIKNLKVVMDTGRLVGEIGDSVNGFLGQQTQNDLRYR